MCQLFFVSKDFETSLLTLLGVSLVLWRRKADNTPSNPLFYGPSPLNSQHLHFQFPITSLLKFFVRSCCDWEKKCREGSRQYIYVNFVTSLPIITSLRIATAFCPAPNKIGTNIQFSFFLNLFSIIYC